MSRVYDDANVDWWSSPQQRCPLNRKYWMVNWQLGIWSNNKVAAPYKFLLLFLMPATIYSFWWNPNSHRIISAWVLVHQSSFDTYKNNAFIKCFFVTASQSSLETWKGYYRLRTASILYSSSKTKSWISSWKMLSTPNFGSQITLYFL